MAFMPFQMQARSRQSAPNYTPQLVQQTGSDLLGAVLAMLQMKQSAADSAANRDLTREQVAVNKEIADRAAKLSERRFDEFEKVSLGIQQKLMEAGLTKEQSEILAQTANRQKETLGGKYSRALESLPGNFDEAVNLSMDNYGDTREALRSLGSQYKTKGMGIDTARNTFQQIAQKATAQILADPDPASQIAGLRVLGLELERAKQWAPKDLEETINRTNNYLGELQASGLSAGAVLNQYSKKLSDSHMESIDKLLKGQEGIASGFYTDKDFAKARIGYGALSPEPDLSFSGLTRRLPKRELNMGPLTFDPVQGLAQTIGPTLNRLDQSGGEYFGGEGASLLNGLIGGASFLSSPFVNMAASDTITPGSAKNIERQALEAANMMIAPQQFSPAAGATAPMSSSISFPMGATNTALEDLLRSGDY